MKKIMWVISIAACFSACNQSSKTESTESAEKQNTQTQNVTSENIANQDLSTVEVEEHWDEEHENIQSDTPPVELHLSQQFNEHAAKIGSGLYLQLDVNAVVDEVEIYEVIVNRGNTCMPRFWYRNWQGHGTLKFGQGVRAHITCDFHAVKEINVSTNHGDYSFEF